MPEQTKAQKKAHMAYISKFARLEIRTTVEQRDSVKAHAEARGESVNGFVNRAISETMERDNAAPGVSEGQTEGIGEAGE